MELKCVSYKQHCSLSMPNMLRLVSTIWKCPDFLPEMSGFLDTRIPPFCNSGWSQEPTLSESGKKQLRYSWYGEMSPEILLTPRFYPSYIQTLKILVKFCCSRTFSNLILLPFRGSRIYRIHILILLKGSRIFLKSGYSLGNIPILLDYRCSPPVTMQ